MREVVLGVLVSGRGTNLQAIMDAIEAGEIPNTRLAVVVSDNPDAPALRRAEARGIPTAVVVRSQYPSRAAFEEALAEPLRQHGVTLVALAGFMRLLSRTFINAFPQRIMNIHPALLPAFPGLDAQGQAVRYGVKVSGCTVHFVDEGMDTGPIILQEAVPVYDDDTAMTLADRILPVEHRLYPRALALYAQGRLVIEGRRVRILQEGGQQ